MQTVINERNDICFSNPCKCWMMFSFCRNEQMNIAGLLCFFFGSSSFVLRWINWPQKETVHLMLCFVYICEHCQRHITDKYDTDKTG